MYSFERGHTYSRSAFFFFSAILSSCLLLFIRFLNNLICISISLCPIFDSISAPTFHSNWKHIKNKLKETVFCQMFSLKHTQEHINKSCISIVCLPPDILSSAPEQSAHAVAPGDLLTKHGWWMASEEEFTLRSGTVIQQCLFFLCCTQDFVNTVCQGSPSSLSTLTSDWHHFPSCFCNS